MVEVIAFLVAAVIIVGPIIWPRGVVPKHETDFLNGTLTEYERVSGFRALRHWWKGELEREPENWQATWPKPDATTEG